MEQFKSALRRRLIVITVYAAVLVGLVCLGLLQPTAGGSEETRAFIAGVYTGLCAVAAGTLIVSAVRYRAAIRDEEKLKALYVLEHDERLLAIRVRMGGAGMPIILYGMLGAAIGAGFFNQTVFFTLLGALIFSAAVKAVLLLYYTKKLT
jgi:hypothetical protein